MDTINWVASILIAIPIGIIANLITPKVQKYFERRSDKSRLAAKTQILKEKALIDNYYKKRSDLYIYLLSVLLKIALIRAALSAINYVITTPTLLMRSFESFISRIDFYFEIIEPLIPILSSTVWLIGMLMIFRLLKRH